MYAGMYGMFFFTGQFMQDVLGYSPLRAGVAFLPVPISVFLSSQLVSKVLVDRIAPKVLMLSGLALGVVSLLLTTQLHAGTTYPQILLDLVLLGLGSGTSLVSLTTASLADVDPADSGAASGLVNVLQQVGAALGLAVLVTVLSAVNGHSQLSSSVADVHTLVHGLDVTFGVAAGFAALAFLAVAVFVRVPASERASLQALEHDDEFEGELVDGEGFEWPEPELVA
jgi:MFS family permease